MTTPNRSRAVLNEFTVEKLKEIFHGELFCPADEGYQDVRRVYNAMIDRYPALIARCADPTDVNSAVNFARQHHLLVAIRGGGHSAAGLGTCDDGLVIDLSQMRGIHVDPDEKTVRVEAGCTLGDLDRATHPFGLAVPTGFVSTTGIAGLTLGGGLGHLSRKYGLTIDNLLGVDLVLADGSFIKASSSQNEDLFWAVRGGGGNFGIVTSFLFRLHPVNNVYGGPMFWHLDQAEKILHFYRDFVLSAPRDISGFFAFLTVPPNPHFPEKLYLQKMCGVIWCYTGTIDKAEEVFEPIRRSNPPALDLVGPLSYPVFQSMFDPIAPPGMQQYWRADFVKEVSEDAIRLHLKYARQMPTMLSTMHLYPINGAAQDIGPTETAFSFRDANWVQMIIGADPDPVNNEKIISWTQDYWLALHPHSAGGAYVNFLMDEGENRIKATYRENYDRLVLIKNRYDPKNFFRLNQNIKPIV